MLVRISKFKPYLFSHLRMPLLYVVVPKEACQKAREALEEIKSLDKGRSALPQISLLFPTNCQLFSKEFIRYTF